MHISFLNFTIYCTSNFKWYHDELKLLRVSIYKSFDVYFYKVQMNHVSVDNTRYSLIYFNVGINFTTFLCMSRIIDGKKLTRMFVVRLS